MRIIKQCQGNKVYFLLSICGLIPWGNKQTLKLNPAKGCVLCNLLRNKWKSEDRSVIWLSTSKLVILLTLELIQSSYFPTAVIVPITKCSIVIGFLHAYLIHNWRAIIWSNYNCPIWTFCNWIAVIGQLCCVNQVHWNGFFIIAVSPLPAKLVIKNIPKGQVDFLILHLVIDTINC